MTAQLENIVRFLKKLDQSLSAKQIIDLYLIGGAAITLAYDNQNRTSDLDFIEPPEVIINMGSEKSDLAKQFKVYVSALAEINFSAPADWKEKCHLIKLGLKSIKIHIPCVEDIVLGKIARLEPKDFEDIIALYEKKVLDPRKLCERLKENKKELREHGYRNNTKLLFKEIFGLNLVFEKGEFKLLNGI